LHICWPIFFGSFSSIDNFQKLRSGQYFLFLKEGLYIELHQTYRITIDIKTYKIIIDYLAKELDLEENSNHEILVGEGELVYNMDK
jgi:hypothetical protein